MLSVVATTDQEIGGRVRSLLEAHRVPQHELAKRVGIDPSALSRAIAGERTFKAREVALIAECLNVPTSLLLDDEEVPSLALAARQSAHSPESVSSAVARSAFFVELATLVDSTDTTDFSWVVPTESGLPWQQGQALAEQILAHTGLAGEPLPGSMHALAATLEQSLAIQVALEPLGPGLDGLSVGGDRLKLAMVSTTTAQARQRWTLAHEVAHLILGDTQDLLIDENIWTTRTTQETRANAFAAAFLMPADLLTQAWGNPVTPDDGLVAKLLDTFHVSLDALAFRLHNLGLVNAAGRDRVRAMYPLVSLVRNQAARQSEGSWLPTGLTVDVIRAYSEGRLGVRWLAALVNLDADELLDRLTASAEEAAALDSADDES